MTRQQVFNRYGGIAVAAMLSGAAVIGAALASAQPGGAVFQSALASALAERPAVARPSRSSLAKQRARMAAKRPPPKNLAVSAVPRTVPPVAAPPAAVPFAAPMPGAAAEAPRASDNPYLAYRQAQPEAPTPAAVAPATASPGVPAAFPPWPPQPAASDLRAMPPAVVAPPVAVKPDVAVASRPASGNPYLAYRLAQPEAAPPVAFAPVTAPQALPSWRARPSSPPVSAAQTLAPTALAALPPASVAAVTPPPPVAAYAPPRETRNPYLPAAPVATDGGTAGAQAARPAAQPPTSFSGVYLGSMQLVAPVRPPMDQAILPTFRKVYPTGDKPLMVVTFKCPTELVGVTPLPTKALHGLVDLGMGALNSSNLLPFNLQQVCQ